MKIGSVILRRPVRILGIDDGIQENLLDRGPILLGQIARSIGGLLDAVIVEPGLGRFGRHDLDVGSIGEGSLPALGIGSLAAESESLFVGRARKSDGDGLGVDMLIDYRRRSCLIADKPDQRLPWSSSLLVAS
jgi:hypothetical protein